MKMQLPVDKSGFGANGIQFEVIDGVVDIPAECVSAAMDHGLTPYDEQTKPEAPKGKGKQKNAPPVFVAGDKVSVRFDGDTEDTICEFVSLNDKGEAMLHNDSLGDFEVDVKYLSAVKV
jgi:hypothetical protein